MKKTFTYWLAVSILLLSIVSCKDSQKNYQQVVPATATGLVAINLKQLGDKAKISEGIQNQLVKMMKDGLKAKDSEKLEKILKNPETSGLSMSDPVLVFANTDNEEFGITAKVKNKSQLEDLFMILQNEGISNAPVQKNTYTEIALNSKGFIVYDNNTFLILFNEKTLEKNQEQAAIYMAQTKEQSIVSNEFFQKMISKGSDISSLYTSKLYSDLMKYSQKMLPSNTPNPYTLIEKTFPENFFILSSLNFEKGSIQEESEYCSSDKAALDKYLQTLPVEQKQNTLFLNRFPASTLLYVGTNINGKKLYEFILPYLKELPVKNDNLDFEKLLASIKGDFSMGITKVGAMGMPSFLVYAEVQDYYLLEFINQQMPEQMKPTANGENAWKVTIPMLNMNFYWGVKNMQFYLTNDSEIYANIEKPAEKPLGSTQQGEKLKNSYAGSMINFDQIVQIPLWSMLAQSQSTGLQTLKSAVEGSDYMVSFVPELTKSSFVFYLKNKEQNSLQTITSGIEQYLPTFMPQN